MDFIAQLTQFIPPWGVRYVHYYGLYSSRCKARVPLEIFGRQSGALGDPGEHPGPDLFVIVKGKHETGPSRPGKGPVRTHLSFLGPADP